MAARPIARSAAPTDERRKPRVRDFSRAGGSVSVTWDVRTVYDFVFSLSGEAGDSDDLPSGDRRWLADAKAALVHEVGEAAELYSSELCIVLAGLAVDRPDVTDAAAFVDLVEHASSDEIIHTLLSEDVRSPETRALAERALAGDAEAKTMLVDLLVAGDSHRREAFAAVLDDVDAMADRGRIVLRAWLRQFSEIEPRIGAIIRRDADARVREAATLAPADLIERTTGGIRWLSEPGIRRVVLAPSYFARPYNYLLGGDDWRLFGYPVADSALDPVDPMAPPQSLVRLNRALGDDTRLRILRLLRDRDLYLTEIAQALELSKPTIKHHLAQLRSAGLVTLTEEGGLSYYSLRRARLDDATAELKHFLVE
jgi:DNA-binding transcriptional ArsR family regulator